jgi:protein-L-isoaspartate(D-aspartate) O-methyltransferase
MPDVHGSANNMASWRSGYAEDCKSLYGGSIPSEASIFARSIVLANMEFRHAVTKRALARLCQDKSCCEQNAFRGALHFFVSSWTTQAGFNCRSGRKLPMSSYAEARRMMVDCQLRTYDITDQVVLAAADSVPRELFVPESRRDVAYADQSVMIAEASGGKAARYLMTPMVVARMLQSLGIQQGMSVLDYAGGTGYSAALAADMGANVILWEKDEALAGLAAKVFAATASNIIVTTKSPTGTFDAILVNGACETPPENLFTLLKVGGRLAAITGSGRSARVILYQRYGDGVSGRPVFDAAAPVLDEYRAPAAFAF